MKPENVTCPECGGAMKSRQNKRDGTWFWGCADYPACKGTRNSEGEAAHERSRSMPSDRLRENDRSRWRQR